ncbi:MAG: hypothetical protein R3B90_11230 [Planctomycetaceae bacterium]
MSPTAAEAVAIQLLGSEDTNLTNTAVQVLQASGSPAAVAAMESALKAITDPKQVTRAHFLCSGLGRTGTAEARQILLNIWNGADTRLHASSERACGNRGSSPAVNVTRDATRAAVQIESIRKQLSTASEEEATELREALAGKAAGRGAIDSRGTTGPRMRGYLRPPGELEPVGRRRSGCAPQP